MSLPWEDPPARCREVHLERDAACRLRDGTLLRADVYRPDGGGPWPVLLMRLPYGKETAQAYCLAHPSWYARRGYLVVVQDCRGRGASEGEWYPFRHEESDGAESVRWAAGLPGSDGRVAMYGFSYAGATQLLAAVAAPPELRCLAPALTGSDFYDGWTYRGGALQQAFVQSWAAALALETARRRGDGELEGRIAAALGDAWAHYWRPVAASPLVPREDAAPYYFDWLRHRTYDDYWRRWSVRARYGRVGVPALHIAGWYDIFLEGTLENYAGLRAGAASEAARREQRLVVGPWYHMPWHQSPGALDLGPDAANCVDALLLLWLDRQLRGERNQLAGEPPVALFVLGENRWRFYDGWPPPGSRPVELHLHSQGRANSLGGNGRLGRERPGEQPPDVFVYDPRNPVRSLGGHSCCNPAIAPMGVFDQRPQEYRNDVLVYTGEPLDEPLRVIGTAEVTLFASSSAAETDFTVKLVDVWPDGRAFNLAEGVLRTPYRDSLERPAPCLPDQPYEYRIRVGSLANVFLPGHRVRLEVSSSNFPAIERGGADLSPATQTVFHDAARPSRLTLPVVDG